MLETLRAPASTWAIQNEAGSALAQTMLGQAIEDESPIAVVRRLEAMSGTGEDAGFVMGVVLAAMGMRLAETDV